MVAKEKFQRKSAQFQREGSSPKEKWTAMKKETGQSKHTSPQQIIEGKNIYTSSKDIATSLNRQYISRVRKIIKEM